MKKISVVVMVLLCVALVFASCAAPVPAASDTAAGDATKGDAAPTGVKKIGIAHAEEAWEMYQVMEKSIREIAEAQGIEVLTANASGDANKQLQQVETMINSGVDGIVSVTIDGATLEPTVKKATANGIAFISLYVPVESATVNIEVNEYDYGYTIGTLAGEYCKANFDGQEVQAALLRMHDYKPGVERGKGMEEAFAKVFPTGKIVSDQHSIDVETAMKATEAILASNPDVKVFMCDSDDTGAVGAYEVLKAKVDEGKYKEYCVIGADGTEQAIKYIQEGGMYRGTIDILPAKLGDKAINTIIDAKAGKEVEKTQYCDFKPIDYDIAVADY